MTATPSQFYGGIAIIAIATVASAQTWNRWYIKRQIVAEFKRQLRIELSRAKPSSVIYLRSEEEIEKRLRAQLSTTTQGFVQEVNSVND